MTLSTHCPIYSVGIPLAIKSNGYATGLGILLTVRIRKLSVMTQTAVLCRLGKICVCVLGSEAVLSLMLEEEN